MNDSWMFWEYGVVHAAQWTKHGGEWVGGQDVVYGLYGVIEVFLRLGLLVWVVLRASRRE